MFVPALVLAVVTGTTITVRVEDAPGMSPSDVTEVSRAFADALQTRTGASPKIDLFSDAPCDSEDRCTDAIKERTGADEIVFVKLLGALTKIRFLAEAVTLESGSRRSAQADLSKDKETWASSFEGLAILLFPNAQQAEPPKVATEATTAPGQPELTVAPKASPQTEAPPEMVAVSPAADEGDPVPWIILGTSVAVGIAATVLGVAAQDARDTIEGPEYLTLTPDEISSKTDLAKNGGLAANIMWGLSGVGIVTSVLMLTDVL